MTWTVPPAASIFSRALLVKASATTNSGRLTSPLPRILSGLSRRAHQSGHAQELLVHRDRGRRGPLRRAGQVALRKAPELDRGADGAHVDDLVLDPVEVAEAVQLRDPDVDRGLAALEPGRDRAAGPGLLALRAAAGGLALARGDAPAHAGLRGVRAFGGPQIVQLHRVSSAASLGELLHLDEEADRADHAARRLVVRHDDRVADPVKPEGLDRRAIAGDVADRALDLGHLEPSGHLRPPGLAGRRRRAGRARPGAPRSPPRRRGRGAPRSWRARR